MHRLYQAQIDLSVMRRHVDVALKGLAMELRDLESEMDKKLADLSEHEQDAYFSNINDYWIETAEALPLLQWYSQLLISYGYFEKALNDVCEELKHANGYKLSLKDLHGQGIARAKNYLVKVAGIEAPFQTHSWAAISAFGDLRNVVAHRSGFVDYEPSKSDSLSSRLARINGVELKQETLNQPDAQIVFGHNLAVSALESFALFCGELATACQAANTSPTDSPRKPRSSAD